MLRVATSILASVACVAPVLADLQVTYHVRVQALIDNSFSITVDLDDAAGHFTQQPNGPIENVDGEYLAQPLATRRRSR